MTAADLRAKIAAGCDRHQAEVLCHHLAGLPVPALYTLLEGAGVTRIRSKDSRSMLLKSLRNNLTARIRADERNEV